MMKSRVVSLLRLPLVLFVSTILLGGLCLSLRPGLANPGTLYVAPGASCGGSVPPFLCYADLQSAVDAAVEDDEIRVAQGTYGGVQTRSGVKQHLYLSKTLTIRGGYSTSDWSHSYPVTQTTTLDAQGQGRVVYVVDTVTPTLEGFVMTGGDAQGLGGFSSSDAGGGVYAFEASPIISACWIVNSQATYGGGVFSQENSPQIISSTLRENQAQEDGGGLYLHETSDVLITGTLFLSNTARNGGGIYADYTSLPEPERKNSMTFSHNVVRGNEATQLLTSCGGGMWLTGEDMEVTHNQIEANLASAHVSVAFAGGVRLGGTRITFTHNTVTSNTVAGDADTVYGGGVLFVEDGYGRAIDSLTFVHNRITLNTAIDEAGGVYLKNGQGISIAHNTVLTNTALDGSGVYLAETENVSFTDNVLAHNAATQYGGGLYASQVTTLTLTSNEVLNNSAESGGGLYVDNSSAVSLRGNVVDDNSVSQVGGGVLLSNISAPLLRANVLSDNSADQQGGGLYVDTCPNVTVLTNTLRANSALADGAGVYINGSSHPLLEDNLIRANVSGNYGGGVHLNSCTSSEVRDNLVDENWADERGGGAYLASSDLAVLEDNRLISNTVVNNDGGGVYLYTSPGVVVDGNTFIHNEAQGLGGALLLAWSDDAQIRANVVMSNTATSNGDGVYIDAATSFALTNNIIAANTPPSGAGVWVQGWSDLYPAQGTLLHNTIANNAGKGVVVGQYASVGMTNTILAGHQVGVSADAGHAYVDHVLWDEAGTFTETVNGGIITSTGVVTGDPAFLSPVDYHVGLASAALNQAVATTLSTDIDGNPRPVHGGYDLGADELYSLTTTLSVTGAGTYRFFDGAEDRLTFSPGETGTLKLITATLTLTYPTASQTGMPRFYSLQGDGSGFTTALSLSYDAFDMSAAGVVTESDVRVYRYSGAGGIWHVYPSTVHTPTHVVTATEITDFSLWALGVAEENEPTRVSVVGFDARPRFVWGLGLVLGMLVWLIKSRKM